MPSGLMGLDFCCHFQMLGHFGIKNTKSMDSSCLVSDVRAPGGGGVEHNFLVLAEHLLNTTVYLSIVADHMHPFVTTVYPSPDGYFQYNAPCRKVQFNFGMWWNGRLTSKVYLIKWPASACQELKKMCSI